MVFTGKKMIRYGCQNINDADIDAVTGVLRSDYLTTGPKVPEFESGLKKNIGENDEVSWSDDQSICLCN